MRILIVTAGSRGDVAPYTGLGARLRRAGHEVSVATHTGFAASVREAGLGFHALPADPRAELSSAAGQRLLHAGTGARAVIELVRMGRALMPALGQGILAAASHGTDLLLLSATTAPLGRVVAEALGLPSMGVFLQPLAPTGAFAPLLAGNRVQGGEHVNRLVGRTVQSATDHLFAPTVRTLRRQLGLPARSALAQRRHDVRQLWPVLHGFSPSVVPRPADWPPGMRVAGY